MSGLAGDARGIVEKSDAVIWWLTRRSRYFRPVWGRSKNAKGRIRTVDTGLFRAVLYLLSYLRRGQLKLTPDGISPPTGTAL